MESKYFKVEEFVSPKIYTKFGDESWHWINPVIVKAANHIRELVGQPVKINDWSFNDGQYQYSGFREYDCKVGATLSEHKFGRAIDIKIGNKTGKEMLQFIKPFFPDLIEIGITRIEDPEYTPTWLHLDCKPGGLVNGNIHIFRP